MADSVDTCIENYKYYFSSQLLRNKVAFITGGGSGIGFTICEILMRHGCQVAIASRNESRVKGAAAKLQAATGQKCLPIQMDVRKPEEIIRAVEKTLAEYGRIDILVNNAAGNFLSPIVNLSFNAFKTVMEIDAHGTFNTSKIVYEKYFQNHGGVIVNITATLHYRGTPLQAHAGAAKAAIDALTKHMAVEWGSSGVRVVGVAPGPIADTEGMRRLGGRGGEERAKDLIPIQRMGRKSEIGHLVLYLASEAGSLITGETIVADGGSSLTGGYNPSQAIAQMKSIQSRM